VVVVEHISAAAVTWVAAVTSGEDGVNRQMLQPLVMTIIGADRPGLVESIAARVTEHEGNWLESRMSRLGGFFAGILQVELPSERRQQLIASLESLKARGLTVVVHPDEKLAAPPAGQIVQLEVVGHDRPGIVRQISQALAAYGVNVEELDTERASAAMSGESLFKARARLSIPESCNTAELRRRLEQIAEDLIVDLTFEEVGKLAAAES
jgi:glycine cleavage system regulatory protein